MLGLQLRSIPLSKITRRHYCAGLRGITDSVQRNRCIARLRLAQHNADDLRRIARTELRHNSNAVEINRARAETERASDFLAGSAFHDPGEHGARSLGQQLVARGTALT
jgi:hypothetical protein